MAHTRDRSDLTPKTDANGARPHDLNDCAEHLVSWIGTLDPMWKERLTIMRAERGFTASQMLGTCAAYVLDESLHMILVPHEALQPNPWRVGEQMRCQGCETLFNPKYPGQPFCSNACAERSRAAVV